jgi:hypothetical protein
MFTSIAAPVHSGSIHTRSRRKKMKYLACVAIFIACGSTLAQKAHKRWKIITDQNKSCQYSVPADWQQQNIARAGTSNSPDNKVTVVLQVRDDGQSLAEVEKNARAKMPPLKVIENSVKRDWYVYRDLADGDDSPDTHWSVAVGGGDHVCLAQITFKSAMGESLVRQIAQTLAPTRNGN